MKKQDAIFSQDFVLKLMAAAEAVTVAWALYVIDGGGDGIARLLSLVRGGLYGAAAGIGVALVASRLPRLKSKTQQRIGWLGLTLAALGTPAVVSPVTFATMSDVMVAALAPSVRWGVAVFAGLMIAGVIVGVAATGGKLEQDEQVQPKAAEQPAPKPKAREPRFRCQQCTWTSAEAEQAGRDPQRAYAAHGRSHTGIPVDLSSFRN